MNNLSALFIALFFFSACTQENTFLLQYDTNLPQARHAAQKLTETLKATGLEQAGEDAAYEINLAVIDTTLGAEAFNIRKDGNDITVTGGDAAGLLYGGIGNS